MNGLKLCLCQIVSEKKATVAAIKGKLVCINVASSNLQSLLFYWTAIFSHSAFNICNKWNRCVWLRKHLLKTLCCVFRIFGYCLISSLVTILVPCFEGNINLSIYWAIHQTSVSLPWINFMKNLETWWRAGCASCLWGDTRSKTVVIQYYPCHISS